MTAICMVLGGSDDRRAEIFLSLLDAQRHHGATRPVTNQSGISVGTCGREYDSSWFEDEAIVVLLTGYLVELGTDGYLYELGGQSPAQWLARRWQRHGVKALDAVDGDYAAVVLDKRSRRVHAIAGPTVIYPLFLARAQDDHAQWVLGSEPKAVLQAAGLVAEMNAEAIAQHLFYLGTVLDPEATPWQGVQRIPAGCLASWPLDATEQFERSLFWDPEAIEPLAGRSRNELRLGLRSAIEESVVHALPANGRSMLALSGGMDSSSIWAVIREAARQGDERAAGIKGYSFLYPGTPSDEQTFIDENHRHWGTIGCYRDIAAERISDSDEYLLSRQDYPLSGSTAYVLRLLVQDLAAGGAETLIAGFSGDFWLNVPGSYQADLLRHGRPFAAVSPIVKAWSKGQVRTGSALRWFANVLLPPGSPVRRSLRPTPPPLGMGKDYRYLEGAIRQWLSDRIRRLGYARAQMLYARETQWRSCTIPLTTMQLLAREGVVLRDPLGSRRLMEWALSVPAEEMAGGVEKALMREAMSGLLPPKVREKAFPTFHGGDPERPHDVFRDLGDPRRWYLVQQGLVDADELLDAWREKASRYELRLERLAMSEVFCRRQFT